MMGQNDVITLKNKLCQPNHHYPEDSRRLEIVQNFEEADVNKTDATFEDKKLKFYTTPRNALFPMETGRPSV